MTPRLFQRARLAVVVATTLAFAAMARYPGGTPRDATSRGYSLSRNFLSDLGMTTAWDHRPNRLGATFFVLSLLVLVAGLGSVVVGISRRLAEHSSARRWARSAAVCGLLACVAFAGVAVTPENHVMAVHITFTQWARRIMTVAAVLLAVAALRATPLRRRVGVVLLVLAGVLATYAILLVWGPDLTTSDGLVFQVVAQKTAAVVSIAALLFIARDLDRSPGAVGGHRLHHPDVRPH